MKVTGRAKLIRYTANPEATIALASKLCYSSRDVDDLIADIEAKDNARFIAMLHSMGHYSPFEHASFTFAIEGVSRALLAQITPHFMYNTLETIVWLAEEGRNSEVVEMTMAFTGFLRISLSRGADYITVEREEQHVANYLQIQSVRYGSIMRYTIDIDPALHERYMLKIVLQPLVENAIYHGIKRRRGRGQITVTGRRQAGGMYFAVEDNGMGMTPERLAEVRTSLQNGAPLDPDGKGGYGLRNVEQRLRLYYGCGLTIESEYRHGTRISFTVPDEQEGKTL